MLRCLSLETLLICTCVTMVLAHSHVSSDVVSINLTIFSSHVIILATLGLFVQVIFITRWRQLGWCITRKNDYFGGRHSFSLGRSLGREYAQELCI